MVHGFCWVVVDGMFNLWFMWLLPYHSIVDGMVSLIYAADDVNARMVDGMFISYLSAMADVIVILWLVRLLLCLWLM